MSKRPSFQFYPGDWLRDSALLSCSVGARGLWIHMLCLMHEGTPYGWLKVGDKVILPANLARMVGATLPEVEGWLCELESAAVFSRSGDGAICSRRMIRDENIRAARASGGKLGGNPALKVNLKVGDKVILPANLQPTPSSSSSSSSSDNTDTPLPPKGGDGEGQTPSPCAAPDSLSLLPPDAPSPLCTPTFAAAWTDWIFYRRERKLTAWKPVTIRAKLVELAGYGEPGAVESIRQSIANGWQGLFAPKSSQGHASAPADPLRGPDGPNGDLYRLF